MLYNLFRDAFNIFRLHFEPLKHYRYALPATIGVLALLGIIKAVGMSPVLGNAPAAVVLSILFSTIQCWALAAGMRLALSKNMPNNPSWWGFVLSSEFLTVPTIVVLLSPQLAVFSMFWGLWSFWVQFAGFLKLSEQKVGKVFLGYLYYLGLTLLFGSVAIMLFDQVGWISAEEVFQRIQQSMQESNP